MKFYVASRVSNAKLVNQAAERLTRCGHERSYDWTRHGDVSAEPAGRKREVAALEAQAVLDAELVLLLLPGGFGTHTEMGLSLAAPASKRILLWSETEAPFDGSEGFCVFYHHPAVERIVCPFPALLERLERL